jgi:hypothetical protein
MSLKNPVTPPGIGPGTVRLVAQHLNHYATPDPELRVLSTVKLHIGHINIIFSAYLVSVVDRT